MKPFNPAFTVQNVHSFVWMILLSLALLVLTTAVAQQALGAQDLLSQADEVLQQMSQITGLPIKGPLKKQVISRPEIEKYLTQNLHEEMTPAEIHAQEALVRALGLVSRDFNLEKFLISFYTEQAAGFYDPKRKTMFIADWIPAETQTMVLSHELTHALQDQSWDLESYLHGARDDDDATNARQAVVEGYATAAMLQQVGRGGGSGATAFHRSAHGNGDSPAVRGVSRVFQCALLFPHAGSLSLRARHGLYPSRPATRRLERPQ